MPTGLCSPLCAYRGLEWHEVMGRQTCPRGWIHYGRGVLELKTTSVDSLSRVSKTVDEQVANFSVFFPANNYIQRITSHIINVKNLL